jgi:DNA-binding IclR family transcriptional regulator
MSSTRSRPQGSPSTIRSSRLSCMRSAAPVRNEARGVLAAVNLAAHRSMISFEELVDALGPHLVSTADRISAHLGERRKDEQTR